MNSWLLNPQAVAVTALKPLPLLCDCVLPKAALIHSRCVTASPEGCTDSQFTCTVRMDIFVSSKKLKTLNLTHTHTHLQMLQRKLYSVFICIFWLLVSLKLWNVWEMYVLKKSSGAAVVKYRFSEIRVIFRSLSKKRQSCKCPVNTYVELHDTNADVREGFRFLPLQFFRSPTIKANLQINTKQSYENC